ncbi:hypothetical protein NUW58_g7405 [Xylaria curta]|uniref:Uncharacterized protein n=1 Tax=Xylaria curta TaxID=42375 RepID=A0ACC1NHI2_9PEZI|nr:hypothetical protein NUW58_g7405 [Xylaria curta]
MNRLEDMQKIVSKLWKLQVSEGLDRSQTEGQSWQIDPGRFMGLAEEKLDSITRNNNRRHTQGIIRELEPFLVRICILGYLLRLHCTPCDVYITLMNDKEFGYPRVKIWMSHTIPSQNLAKFLEHAVCLAVPTLDYGTKDLPRDVSISWALHNQLAPAETVEREHRLGGIPEYSGELDLWGCLECFPDRALDLGWFREVGEGEPADSELIQYYG